MQLPDGAVAGARPQQGRPRLLLAVAERDQVEVVGDVAAAGEQPAVRLRLDQRQERDQPAGAVDDTPELEPPALGDLDENDPGSVARFMKKMGRELGDDMGEDFESAVDEAMAEGDAEGGEGGEAGTGSAESVDTPGGSEL